MNNYSEREDASQILLSSYDGNENINELLTFFILIKKFNIHLLKEIYTPYTFNKYFEILKKINLINDIEDVEITETYKTSLSKIISINTDWLKYFINLVEIKSMTSAAKKLNLTKSALSKSITGIEETLQVNLFERDKNFEELTYAGKIIYEKSKEILNSLIELNMTCNELKSKEMFGEINIAWFSLWGRNIIFESIKNFITKYPDVYFKTNFVPKNKIENLILEGVYDIGFMPYEPLSENIEIAEVIDIEYGIVGSPQHKKNWNEFSYIVNFNKINRFSHSNILSSWPDEEYKRKIIMECGSLNIVVDFCKLGFGVSYLPLSFIKKELEEGTLAVVADVPFKRENKLYIVYCKDVFITSLLSKFIKELKNSSENTKVGGVQ